MSRTELREMLALAWDAAGIADCAAGHYRWVVSAWRSADAQSMTAGNRSRAPRLTLPASRQSPTR